MKLMTTQGKLQNLLSVNSRNQNGLRFSNHEMRSDNFVLIQGEIDRMNEKRRDRMSKLQTSDKSYNRPLLGSKLVKIGVISNDTLLNFKSNEQRSMTSFSNQRLQIVNDLNSKALQKSTVQSVMSREN
jgi:hypothetical protein